MKHTHKYIKTRGQLNASEQTKLPTISQQSLTNINKKSSSTSSKEQPHDNKHVNSKIKNKQPTKTKKIAKYIPIQKLKHKSKAIKLIIKAKDKFKNKNKFPPKITNTKLQKNSQKKNLKIQYQANLLNNIKVKEEPKSTTKKNVKLIKQNLPISQLNQLIKIQSTKKLINGTQSNKKYKKKSQTTKSKTKIEVKHQHIPTQKIKIQNQSLPKPITKSQKVKKLSKIIEELQPQQVNNLPVNIIIEPSVQIKKKGRPKKIITEEVFDQRSPDQQTKLEEFIQSAIKLRKLKSEKQFFESFSRLTQYAQQSWQYGDLNREIKWMPQRWEILKIGVPIVRGIRKQIQQQQLLNLFI